MTIWPLMLFLSAEPTGLQLQRMCNGEPPSEAWRACVMYVSGFAEGARAANAAWTGTRRPFACVPDGVTGEDVRQATLKGLRQPGRRTASMEAVMVATLAESYPCR